MRSAALEAPTTTYPWRVRAWHRLRMVGTKTSRHVASMVFHSPAINARRAEEEIWVASYTGMELAVVATLMDLWPYGRETYTRKELEASNQLFLRLIQEGGDLWTAFYLYFGEATPAVEFADLAIETVALWRERLA